MTGNFLLDWLALAVSLFNTILLLWLGLTVLLNAERRNWGLWLAGSGLLAGAGFFVSHSAILGRSPYDFGPGMDFWWRVGWGPVIALPLAWYLVMLWYTGYWEGPQSTFRRRQRPWLALLLLLSAALMGMLLLNALPSFSQLAQFDLTAVPALGGVPLLILIYPAYIVLCLALSLDALARPGPAARTMGDLARRRARPWLAAATVVLLLVCFLVAAAMVWIVTTVRGGYLTLGMIVTLGSFDLLIAALIGLATILLGQAIVAYEVFTGKTLPRRGLARYWQRAIILAAGVGAVVGWAVVVHLRSIYSLLLTILLLGGFYALLSWRAFAERERFIETLRPFVTSQGLYEHLLASPSAAPVEMDVAAPLRALCEGVLGASQAALIPLGPLAPLSGPLTYPSGGAAPALADILPQLDSPQTISVPLDPIRYAGATWAIPLWSERGRVGALLLGAKRDGSFYTQEEIEIARAAAERLIDTQASVEMARRLMALQRQRFAETQVIDRRARRALHDDILPRLHTALLALSADPGPAATEAVMLLTDAHRQISDLLRQMPAAAAPEVARLGLAGALQRMVADELPEAFDRLDWQIEPQAEATARTLPALSAEVLFYAAREAIRNASRHGRGRDSARPLHVCVALACRDGLELSVEDDGVGVAETQAAGEPNSEGSPSVGSGQGLALHSTLMAVIGGTLAVDSLPGQYTRVTLMLPSVS